MGSKPKESQASKTQARLAELMFNQTQPIRTALYDRSGEFLSGGADVMDTPAYLAFKSSSDRNFNKAKDNVVSRVAPGGALVSALAGLEGDRASTLTEGAGQLYDAELNRALQLGTGASGQSLGSLGQAGANQAQVAMAQGTAKGGMAEGLGSGVGAMLGGK